MFFEKNQYNTSDCQRHRGPPQWFGDCRKEQKSKPSFTWAMLCRPYDRYKNDSVRPSCLSITRHDTRTLEFRQSPYQQQDLFAKHPSLPLPDPRVQQLQDLLRTSNPDRKTVRHKTQLSTKSAIHIPQYLLQLLLDAPFTQTPNFHAFQNTTAALAPACTSPQLSLPRAVIPSPQQANPYPAPR